MSSLIVFKEIIENMRIDWMYLGLGWIAGSVLFFLSLWIVIPAANVRLLPLAVGAPEISPLLLSLSSALLPVVLFLALRHRALSLYGLVTLLLVTVVLSSQPLIQQPRALAQAERSLSEAFGSEAFRSEAFESETVEDTPSHTSSAFSWLTFYDGFFGAERLYSPTVRHQASLPFTTASDPVPLFLDVYQPPETGQYPAVVMIYGGGWRTGSSAANESFGRFLASRGYVAIAIDYRHIPDYRFPTQLEDVEQALDFVRSHAKKYEITSDRISLLGWSAGAQLAMLAGFRSTEPIQSIINFYGPVNLTRGYNEPPNPDPLDVRQVLMTYLGGSPTEKPDAYIAASPITLVKSAQPNTLPPMLLIYGGQDNIVERRFGKSLHEQLLTSGNTSVWVDIPWAEHAFDKVFSGVSNQMALHFIEQFLTKTL